jgi:hypothetical protein
MLTSDDVYDSVVETRWKRRTTKVFPGRIHAGARALPDMEAFHPITFVPTRGIGPGRECFRVSPGI